MYMCIPQPFLIDMFCVWQDGRNYTSPSRFPCYYTPNHGDFVAANLDLEVSEAKHFPRKILCTLKSILIALELTACLKI